ncbi:transposase [Salipiger pacificus]|uniref:Transposase n=1 Tax=Salipiger mangrovisoli TaxID=2865933 RepID=A0ABR9WYY5_9RHOB|nr:transposase [Salipiger mangrovisoli]
MFSEAAIQARLTLKQLFGLSLRQTAGLVESPVRMAGLMVASGLFDAVPTAGADRRADPVSPFRETLETSCGQHRDRMSRRRQLRTVHIVGTAAPGRKTAPRHCHETTPCGRRNTSAGDPGGSGPVSMSGVGPRLN